MEKVRRQHYVPRMYLKRFGYGNIGDEYISVLKLDNGTVLDNRKVENFAVANYFYDADKEQIAEILKEDLKVFPELCDNENLSDDQFTEHVLAREESAISKMLNELQEDLSTIHISSNRNLMIIFLHSLAYRTKQFRDQMDAINNKTEKQDRQEEIRENRIKINSRSIDCKKLVLLFLAFFQKHLTLYTLPHVISGKIKFLKKAPSKCPPKLAISEGIFHLRAYYEV